VSNSAHYFRPLQSAVLARSNPPGMDKEREAENKQRDGDLRFRRALAEAFWRGDHLREGEKRPLRLLG